MSKRLINLSTILGTKVQRKRTWLKKQKDFPPPVVPASGCASALWDEADVDRWIESLIARSTVTTATESASRRNESKKKKKRSAAAEQSVACG